MENWKAEIEKHGGKVANTAIGVTCIVASNAERDRGGSSRITESVEKGIRVVREEWLRDCIEKKYPQPLEAYDVASDLVVGGRVTGGNYLLNLYPLLGEVLQAADPIFFQEGEGRLK